MTVAASPAMTASSDAAPCAVESRLWRECLKTYDYSPDRPVAACDGERSRYYACVKDWSARTQAQPYRPQSFELPSSCASQAETLHQCMMMNAFEMAHCHAAMTQLKKCVARYDVHVRRALQDDDKRRAGDGNSGRVTHNNNDDVYDDDYGDDGAGGAAMLRRRVTWLWHKAIGKA